MNLQARQRRGENPRRARPGNGETGRIAGCQQWAAHAFAQRGPGFGIVAAQTHQHVDMRRTDAQIEHRPVELVNRRAPGCPTRRTEGNLPGAAGIVDQCEELGIAQITDMKRAARARDRQCGKIKDEPRLMGVVLEFTDRTPSADAPAIAGVGKMSAGDLSWTFCERYAFHGWPC